jgi:predicted RNA-binding Zn ribbon-like protein
MMSPFGPNVALAETMRQDVHGRIVARVEQGTPFWQAWDAEIDSWLSTARDQLDPDTLHYSKQLIIDVAAVRERLPQSKPWWRLW